MDNRIISALETVTEGDKEFLHELSAAFIVNFKEFSESVIKSVDQKDQTSYKAIAHKVKPSFLTIKMDDEFEKIEAFGKDLEQKSTSEIEGFKLWILETVENTNDTLSTL